MTLDELKQLPPVAPTMQPTTGMTLDQLKSYSPAPEQKPILPQATPAPLDNIGQNYNAGKINAGDVVIQGLGKAAGDAGNEVFNKPLVGGWFPNPIGVASQAVQGLSGLAAKGISSVVEPVAKGIGSGLRNLIGAPNADAIKERAKTVLNSPIPKAIIGTGQKLSEDPQFTGDLQATSNIAQLAAGAVGAKEVGESLPEAGMAIKNKIIPPLQDKYVNDLATTYREVAGNTQKASKTLNTSLARGKDPAQFLAERNITPEIEKGKMRTTTAQNSIDTYVKPMNEHMDMALKEIEPSIPKSNLQDIRVSALAKADDIPNLTESSKADIKAAINKEFNLQIEKYGEEVGITKVQNIKKANWADTRFDSTKPYQADASYLIGKASKDAIENAVPEGLPVRELNNAIGNAYDAKKFLGSLDGKAVKGGMMTRLAARTVGAIAGHAIPIPGSSIVGALGGDAVMDMLQKNTFSGPLKNMILKNFKMADPEAYQQAIKFIQNSKIEGSTRLALPAPEPLGTSKNPIIPPAPTTYEAQAPKNNYTPIIPQLKLTAGNSSEIPIPLKGNVPYIGDRQAGNPYPLSQAKSETMPTANNISTIPETVPPTAPKVKPLIPKKK